MSEILNELIRNGDKVEIEKYLLSRRNRIVNVKKLADTDSGEVFIDENGDVVKYTKVPENEYANNSFWLFHYAKIKDFSLGIQDGMSGLHILPLSDVQNMNLTADSHPLLERDRYSDILIKIKELSDDMRRYNEVNNPGYKHKISDIRERFLVLIPDYMVKDRFVFKLRIGDNIEEAKVYKELGYGKDDLVFRDWKKTDFFHRLDHHEFIIGWMCSQLPTQHFVRTLDYYMDYSGSAIVMERVDMNIYKYYSETTGWIEYLYYYVFQAMFALAAMNSIGITHYDMHMGNQMVKKYEGGKKYFRYKIKGETYIFPSTPYVLKVGDFGYATKWTEPKILSLELIAGMKGETNVYLPDIDVIRIINDYMIMFTNMLKYIEDMKPDKEIYDFHEELSSGTLNRFYTSYQKDMKCYEDGDSINISQITFEDKEIDDFFINMSRAIFKRDVSDKILRSFFTMLHTTDGMVGNYEGIIRHPIDVLPHFSKYAIKGGVPNESDIEDMGLIE